MYRGFIIGYKLRLIYFKGRKQSIIQVANDVAA